MKRMFLSRTAAETKAFGRRLAKQLKPGDVVFLKANLGAGKTTLVQGLVKALGVSQAALSPTFVIAQTYDGKFPIHHLDFYRLSQKEIFAMGVEDYFTGYGAIPKGLVLIEWPERCPRLKPSERLEIRIRIQPRSTTRLITLTPYGTRFKNLSFR